MVIKKWRCNASLSINIIQFDNALLFCVVLCFLLFVYYLFIRFNSLGLS